MIYPAEPRVGDYIYVLTSWVEYGIVTKITFKDVTIHWEPTNRHKHKMLTETYGISLFDACLGTTWFLHSESL